MSLSIAWTETARDHRHAPLLWPGGHNSTATRAPTRPVAADVVPTRDDVIVKDGPGDEELRREDEVAHKPASTSWCIDFSKDWRGIDR